jgi:3-hydroxyisobutyrate dehydrogenase
LKMAKVAFIGLGNMGAPMVSNLLKADHQVAVFDLMPAAIAAAVGAGARAATNAVDACDGVDFVISMLPAGKHVESVYLGEEGVLSRLNDAVVVLDCSTIDAETARRVNAAAADRGIAFIDAPVSGGVGAAVAGTLSFMCGGSDEAFEKAKTVLSAMGKNIFHAGPSGSGQVAKICNNMLLAVHMIGTAEALKLGADNGLDASVLSEIMLASSGRNWSLELYNPYPGVMPNVPASNEYKPGFKVDLMCKDLGLALDTAIKSGSATPMGAAARSLYTAHQRSGHGDLDFSSILKLLGEA